MCFRMSISFRSFGQRFTSASRRIASESVGNSSEYEIFTGLLERVYFAPFPVLCVSSRDWRSLHDPQ